MMRLSLPERRMRWIGCIVALVPIVGSFFYAQNWRLPVLQGCPFLYYIGIPCPGWGLTRSFMAIAKGEWQQAIAHHLLGPVLFAALLALVIGLLVELLSDRNQGVVVLIIKPLRQPRWLLFWLLAFWSYHGTRLYALGRSGQLSQMISHSALGQWLN